MSGFCESGYTDPDMFIFCVIAFPSNDLLFRPYLASLLLMLRVRVAALKSLTELHHTTIIVEPRHDKTNKMGVRPA